MLYVLAIGLGESVYYTSAEYNREAEEVVFDSVVFSVRSLGDV